MTAFNSTLDTPKVAILTVSDRCSNKEKKDSSGPALVEVLQSRKWIVKELKVVPDDITSIQECIYKWVDEDDMSLILTTGGTGFGIRDVTPEAVEPLLDRKAPGLVQAMLRTSLEKTPFAALSRPVAGSRKKTLILTLPGSPKAAVENIEAVLSVLPHAMELLRGDSGEQTHASLRAQRCHCSKEHKSTSVSIMTEGEQKPLSQALDTPTSRRLRHSPYTMLSVEEATEIVLKHAEVTPKVMKVVDTNIAHAVLAQDVYAKEPVPGYPASIVDGYAIIASGRKLFRVVSPIIAGDGHTAPIQDGEAARIATGAPIPQGANAVVMIEETQLIKETKDGVEEEIMLTEVVSPGDNIRPVGIDVAMHSLIMRQFERISPSRGDIGTLLSSGVQETPRVAILSTGNEVVDGLAKAMKYGQVRDSNRPILISLCKKHGFETLDFKITPDNPEALEKALQSSFEKADVIITSGGVSMGDKDLLKPILEHRLGATIHFGRVKMKPGKPTTFATYELKNASAIIKKKLLFCLPGNPVSCLVTFYLFVLPALKKMSGSQITTPVVVKAKLMEDIKLDSRPEYYRAYIKLVNDDGGCHFEAFGTGSQQSSRLLSMHPANAILQLPASGVISSINKGEFVDAIMIDTFN